MEASRGVSRLLSVIDVGSHAVRLVIAEAGEGGDWRVLESFWNPVTLGNDIFDRGVVRHSSLASLIAVLQQYREVLASWQVSGTFAVASSSLAEASNVETCIERIASATGIRLVVLEPADEALAVFRACSEGRFSCPGIGEGTSWILMARSGMTQSIMLQDGSIMFYGAHNDGALRFSRNLDLPEPSLQRVLPFVISQSVQSIKASCGIGRIDRCIAFNEDIPDLLDRIRAQVLPCHELTADEFADIARSIPGISAEAMRERWGLPETQTVTARISLLVIGMLFAESGAGRIAFPRMPLTSAIMDALVRREGGFPDSLREGFEEQVLSAAHAIGRKYHYDEKHARECERIAGMIFDELADTFQTRERILVRVAAVLHDIGMFVSSKGHHRHSAELVAALDILGISCRELEEISWTVRFHRKGLPGGAAVGYKAMDKGARLSIFRMAAVIRLADALSEPGLPRIEHLALRFGDAQASLQIALAGQKYEYLEIMRVLLANKKQYFENYYGTELVLERLRTVDGT